MNPIDLAKTNNFTIPRRDWTGLLCASKHLSLSRRPFVATFAVLALIAVAA